MSSPRNESSSRPLDRVARPFLQPHEQPLTWQRLDVVEYTRLISFWQTTANAQTQHNIVESLKKLKVTFGKKTAFFLSLSYLCGLSWSSLAHEHSGLMIFQTLQERFLVLPDRQRDALLQDVVVSGGEGLTSERVELRRNGLFRQLGENLGWERASGRGCGAIRGCLIESTFRMRHQTKRKKIESKTYWI